MAIPPIIPPPAKAKPKPVALPPILPAPARGTTGAQRASQQQKAAAYAYHQTAPVRPVQVPPSGMRIPAAYTRSPSSHAPPSHTDATSSGPGYGSAQATAYKQTQAYRAAIIDTFLHQPTAQKAAIISGVVRQSGFAKLPEYHAIRDAYAHLTLKEQSAIPSLIPHDIGKFISPKTLSFSQLLEAGRGGSGPGPSLGPMAGSIVPFGQGTLGRRVAINAAKDAVNLPAEAVSTIGTLGGDVVGGHVGKLASDLISGPKGFIEHPGTILDHPLDAYLTFAGPVHGATRLAGGAIRRVAPDSAIGRAVTPSVPPSVSLTGKLTHERPAYSPYPLIKAGQKAAEGLKYKRLDSRTLVPRSENVRARLTRKEVSRSLVGVRERVRRAGVQAQVQAHARAVLAPKIVRAAHSAKVALRYDPGSALIHGANVLSLIADHTIRTKALFFKDLQKHLDAVVAHRPALDGMPGAIKDYEATVAHLRAALKDRALRNPKNLDKLFKAAHDYAHDVSPLQKEAFAHGHFHPDMTQEGLLRRELQPVVLAHMPGARLDPELGMVLDTAHGTRALSTKEMVAFDKTQTGGRPLAYTSHARPRGDSAFYKNQQQYPSRQMQRNSGFAFHHGLRDVTHEALLEHRVELENAINAHRAMDKILSQTVLRGQDVPHSSTTGFWRTGDEARADAPEGMVPIRVGRMTGKGEGAAPTVENLSNEAERRSLDLNERLRATDEAGQWGLIDHHVLDQLRKHSAQISPNVFLRGFRGTTGQFRKVALGTSVRHIPGVTQEGLIRDIGAGIFLQHGVSGVNVLKALGKLDPRTDLEKAAGVPREHAANRLVRERQTELAGGMVAGMTRALATRQGARHFEGTVLYKPMRAFEAFTKAPGPRQLGTAWNAWTHVVIDGTKRVIEQNQQSAALGKALHRQLVRTMALQGRAAQEAARGLLSDTTARQLRSEVQRTMGVWTDMTPGVQMAMMFSPFGMWWVNSVSWLARMPIDQPVKTGILAGATVSTEKQRKAEGLDMFAPNALPGYLQGSIPSGNKLIGQQYYSPFGVAGDPMNTLVSLTEPTLLPFALAFLGDNYLGRSLRSPSDPHGRKIPNAGIRALVAINSVLSNFVPLWTKAQTVRQGGASGYDTSTQFNIQTKTKNGGLGAGLAKAFQPLREYPVPAIGAGSGQHPDPFHSSRSGNPDPFAGASSNPDPFK